MKPNPRIAAGVVALVAAGALAWWLFARDSHGPRLSGYVEGETLYLSSATAGTLSAVSVQRGDRVVAGQPLFVIDGGPLIGQRDQAAAAVEAAKARAEDARKGQRPTELSVYDAELAAARAALRQATAEFNRVEPLVRRGIFAPARLDQARAARDTAAAEVRAVEQRRAVGTLAARPDAIAAADAQVAQAEAALRESQSRVDQVSPKAPTAARVQEVFFQPGEWAAPNQPVVGLIPDDRVRLRFFVPEESVAKYRVGGTVRFSCDACRGGSAKIDFISPRPEFTPPIIYSRDTRERMVFLVEARPADPRALNPGQPVDVEPLR